MLCVPSMAKADLLYLNFGTATNYDGEATNKVSVSGTLTGDNPQTITTDAGTFLWEKAASQSSNTNVNTNHLRWYKGDILHITPAAGVTITKVRIKCTASNYCKNMGVSTGSITIATATPFINVWTGEANTEFTITASDAQVRCSWIEVEYTKVEGAVATPTIAMGENNTVVLSHADGADIYYTLDETTPSASSTKYEVPFTITGLTTVSAIAVKEGKSSAVVSKSVNLNTVGSIAEFIELASADAVKINAPVTAAYQNGINLYVKDANGDFLLVYGKIDGVTAQNGDVFASVTGTWSPYNGLPEMAVTAIGDKSAGTAVEPELIESIEETPGDRLSLYVVYNNVNIVKDASDDKGKTYTMTDENGDNLTLYNNFVASDNRYTPVEIPEGEGFNVYGFISTHKGTPQLQPVEVVGGQVMETVATPVFTPASGSALSVGDQITIECETEGAKIYFTTGNETPTADSQLYEGPLTFSEEVTINAIAVMDGMLDSEVVSATYTLYDPNARSAMYNFGDAAELVLPEGVAVPTVQSKVNENSVFNDKTFISGDISLLFTTTATSNNTYPQWWLGAKSLEARVYNGTTMTFAAATGKITSITFTKGGNSTSWTWPAANKLTITPAAGTLADQVWTAPEGGVQSVSFEFGASARIGTIEVAYAADTLAGIEGIGADNSDAPVEYFNLQGIRVSASNLTPGIYVRRQGSSVVKVLVK